jgi:eukaryotic-like serine/threonine-protein kinase
MRQDQLIGKVINNFEIQEVLGRGGMGIVYRAYHPDLQLYSAVKIMRPDVANQPGFYERFLQEARTIARLQHPNIVDVMNFGLFEESYYLMMDFVQGPSLRELLSDNKRGLPLWDAINISWQIADVLVYSHSAGVLHRDLKPDNILLTRSVRPNRPYRAIVTDFGLVKLGQGSLLETQEGISLGTPAYMSPEQCKGEEVDGRTDIYALGVMLYESAVGTRPYPVRNLFDAIRFHNSGKIVSPRAHNPQIPPEIERMILHMMHPSLKQRTASAADATDELGEFVLKLSDDGRGKPPSAAIAERIVSYSEIKGTIESVQEEPSEPTLVPDDKVQEEYFIQVAFMEDWDDKLYPMAADPLLVGRLATSDIVLDNPEMRYVSKKHCEIKLEEDRVLIRDLGSTNGTTLGQTKLEPNVLYQWNPGMTVFLGPYKLGLKTEEDLQSVPSPPTAEPKHMPETAVNASYKVICPDAVPGRLPLVPENPIMIGRAFDCDMVLNSAHVSKHHCRIQLTEDGVEIVDMRSTNGTYLNNQRIPPHTPVHWGDIPSITVGPFTISLEGKSRQ